MSETTNLPVVTDSSILGQALKKGNTEYVPVGSLLKDLRIEAPQSNTVMIQVSILKDLATDARIAEGVYTLQEFFRLIARNLLNVYGQRKDGLLRVPATDPIPYMIVRQTEHGPVNINFNVTFSDNNGALIISKQRSQAPHLQAAPS